MTDARMPERYLNDRRINRLTDAAFRAFVTAMMWSVSNQTDGVIGVEDLEHVPKLTRDLLDELILAGLVVARHAGWLLADYEDTQTSRDELQVLANGRRVQRMKKQRQRAARKEDHEVDVPGDVPGDVYPGTSLGTAQDRTGQARQGQAGINSTTNTVEFVNELTGEVTEELGWATVAIPLPDPRCGVCSAVLLSPVSKSSGVCGKADSAHRSARAAA